MALYREPFIQDCADRDRCHSLESVVNQTQTVGIDVMQMTSQG